ncbi:hypothetical protein HOT82_gp112 [Gordonia phage Ronaldo]|uniref:Uncharacterized protein n=3 Tax=Ronaldovirus ronaldo TaxID=2734270 RepID=A0A6B9LEM1_9CAUD|nr:hypothetical protein HOT82_gp112 [Gordonia phage Ronaldo]AXN53674.1 hypothetical protein SEA_RONALDO_112 [Gordonia phage Ronaldo]QDH48451.1 hypothetical protein SEA_ZIKO_113 [Gordonia phage Ziko]QHB38228.1 hypothetical protein SEA_VOLT_114 [Gordonia phage Volt]QTF81898.1 hypothetical protein SEA_GUEY18_115 [Gordonia phage Guey18]
MATELLKMVAAQRVLYERPSIYDLIAATPEIVLLLRRRATIKTKSNDDVVSHSETGSAPPMNLGLIAQADREAALLAHWAKRLGLQTDSFSAYRVQGEIRGVNLAGSPRLLLTAVDFLMAHDFPDEAIEGPQGIWSLRKQTFNIAPDVGVRFLTKGNK